MEIFLRQELGWPRGLQQLIQKLAKPFVILFKVTTYSQAVFV